MSLTVIDLDALIPGIKEKIKGYGGMTVVQEDEEGFGVVVLIEDENGWSWAEISQCEKVGAKKPKLTAVVSYLKH